MGIFWLGSSARRPDDLLCKESSPRRPPMDNSFNACNRMARRPAHHPIGHACEQHLRVAIRREATPTGELSFLFFFLLPLPPLFSSSSSCLLLSSRSSCRNSFYFPLVHSRRSLSSPPLFFYLSPSPQHHRHALQLSSSLFFLPQPPQFL